LLELSASCTTTAWTIDLPDTVGETTLHAERSWVSGPFRRDGLKAIHLLHSFGTCY